MSPRHAFIRWKALTLAIGGIVVAALLASPLVVGCRRRPPEQPIRFSHKAHNQEAECEACHEHVSTGYSAGTGNLASCMDCHDGIQSKDPAGIREEKKLETYAAAQREIAWVRLPPLSQDIFFSHRQHTALSKIKCATCHGNIGETTALPDRRAVRFTMSWCVQCHESRKASLDCLECHR